MLKASNILFEGPNGNSHFLPHWGHWGKSVRQSKFRDRRVITRHTVLAVDWVFQPLPLNSTYTKPQTTSLAVKTSKAFTIKKTACCCRRQGSASSTERCVRHTRRICRAKRDTSNAFGYLFLDVSCPWPQRQEHDTENKYLAFCYIRQTLGLLQSTSGQAAFRASLKSMSCSNTGAWRGYKPQKSRYDLSKFLKRLWILKKQWNISYSTSGKW